MFLLLWAMIQDQRQWSRGQKLQRLIREYQREERGKYQAWLAGLTREDLAAIVKTMPSKELSAFAIDWDRARSAAGG